MGFFIFYGKHGFSIKLFSIKKGFDKDKVLNFIYQFIRKSIN